MIVRLFQLTYDGEEIFVEAPSIVEAILLWRSKNGRESEKDFEPEKISMLSNEPVMRAKHRGNAKVEKAAQAVVDAWMDDADLADEMDKPTYDLAKAVAALRELLESK